MSTLIFQRTQKGILLTTKGTEFLTYARQILEQVGLSAGFTQRKYPYLPWLKNIYGI